MSFRGYEHLGVGPREIGLLGGDPLGARLYALGTVELIVPNGLPPELGIKTALFTDFGWIGLTYDDDDECVAFNVRVNCSRLVEQDFSFRGSYGLSIGWRSPLGPVQFDIADTYKAKEYDRTKLFRFSIGTTF